MRAVCTISFALVIHLVHTNIFIAMCFSHAIHMVLMTNTHTMCFCAYEPQSRLLCAKVAQP